MHRSVFDASGMARDGKPYANTYAWFFEMREGKVVEASAFFDSLAFNDLWQRVTPDAGSGERDRRTSLEPSERSRNARPRTGGFLSYKSDLGS